MLSISRDAIYPFSHKFTPYMLQRHNLHLVRGDGTSRTPGLHSCTQATSPWTLQEPHKTSSLHPGHEPLDEGREGEDAGADGDAYFGVVGAEADGEA